MDRPIDYLTKKESKTVECTDGTSSAKNHNNLGVLLQLQGDLKGAWVQYVKALEIEPSNATALNNL